MPPIWTPSPDRVARANLTRFADQVGVDGFEELHEWSLSHPGEFWAAAWDHLGMIGERGDTLMDRSGDLADVRFHPDARLNVAENLLAGAGAADDDIAMIFRGEDTTVRPGVTSREITWNELRTLVGRLQLAMRRVGVGEGDRVAAWLPNIPETYAVMLAAASIGAVFSSTSPDFGVDGVIDRFSQISPTVLFACDGYPYGGRVHDRVGPLAEVAAALPTVRDVIVVPFMGDGTTGGIDRAITLEGFVDGIEPRPPEFVRLPFDHPWYILFSSGTTGKPKCIVHRTGGVLLKHLVEHQLHCDVKPGDHVFYFTTAGWMMWNWLASGLASGATLVLYDGSPFHPDGNRLFDLIDEVDITLFGTSAKFIESVAKAGIEPITTHDLSSLRTITSTGSTLVAEGFHTVHESIKADVHLASISGGTDLCGCLVAGDPTSSVWAGEIQRPALGLEIDVVGPDGAALGAGERGELVCRSSFPSVPLRFVDDPDDQRFHAAYFDRFPGIWHQGDFAERTEHGGFVIHGRSDATLNPGGVRIGTAEIYRQVDKVPEVLEAIVIGQDWGDDTRVVLFVVLRDGEELTDPLIATIKQTVREGATPRHVPSVIAAVPEIPRTRSGKIVELAVRKVVHGLPIDNTEAIANPESLGHFAGHPSLDVG